MSKDVIICIGTIDSPTFKKCHKIIIDNFKDNKKVLKISIIKNKKPRNEWLNEMIKESIDSGAKWCLQVDEDMYLYNNALDELYNFAISSDKKVLNASCLLNDLFLNSKIGSLKLWNVEALRFANFKDVLGSDRQYAKDLGQFGFENIAINKVLADHDSAPTPEIAYKKYYEYIEKIYKFNGKNDAASFLKFLEKKSFNEIGAAAYNGALNKMNWMTK